MSSEKIFRKSRFARIEECARGIILAAAFFMTEKKHKELQDLLKEGASALVGVRTGLHNACAELRTVYSKVKGKGRRPVHSQIGKRRSLSLKP